VKTRFKITLLCAFFLVPCVLAFVVHRARYLKDRESTLRLAWGSLGEVMDLGHMADAYWGERLARKFRLLNTVDTDLSLSVQATCSCTEVSLAPKNLPSGAAGELVLQVDTSAFGPSETGDKSLAVVVTGETRDGRTAQAMVKGAIGIAPSLLVPPEVSFGRVNTRQAVGRKQTLHLRNVMPHTARVFLDQSEMQVFAIDGPSELAVGPGQEAFVDVTMGTGWAGKAVVKEVVSYRVVLERRGREWNGAIPLVAYPVLRWRAEPASILFSIGEASHLTREVSIIDAEGQAASGPACLKINSTAVTASILAEGKLSAGIDCAKWLALGRMRADITLAFEEGQVSIPVICTNPGQLLRE